METELTATERIRAIRNRIKALVKHDERKLEKQKTEALEAGLYGRYAQIADSLMADPLSVRRGMAKAEIINIHTNEIEEVALNPAFDAVENAELMYRKARRGKRGHDIAVAQMTETESRVAKLKTALETIDGILKCEPGNDVGDTTVGANDIRPSPKPPTTPDPTVGARFIAPRNAAHTEEDIERVLDIAAEFLPPSEVRPAGKKKNEPPPPPFKKFTIDGWEIYMGKTATQNDELSTRFAKPADIWMHVAGYAGSHVIIRHKKDTPPPPKEVMEKAAQIAVWNSKAKHTSYAEVHVTEARFVRKRRHAPAGEVIAERCKTIRVEPKDPKELLKNQ